MLRVDGGFAGRPEWNLITRNVIDNVKDGQRPVSGGRTDDICKRARALKLAAGNRVNQEADLGLEDAARYALEQNFGFIAGTNPLQRVLLECGGQLPVLLAIVDENHGWAEGRRDNIHTRPQRELGDKAARGGSNGGLLQIELSVGKLVAQTHDRRVFAIDGCTIRLPGAIFCCSSLGHRLLGCIEIALSRVERRLCNDVLLE